MLTDQDITKLLTKMGGKFPTLDEYSHLEKRFDELGDRVNELPTRADMEQMLERTYNLSLLKTEHERIKVIIREHLHVEV